MTKFTLFTNRTVVALVLFTMLTNVLAISPAQAEGDNKPADPALPYCQATVKSLEDQVGRFSSNCTDKFCISRSDDCMTSLDAKLDKADSDTEKCSIVANYCPQLLVSSDTASRDADTMNELRKRARDARRDLLQASQEARKDSREDNKDSMKSQQDAMKAQQDAQKEYRQAVNDAEKSKADKVAQTQQGFDEINKAMVDMRAELRNKETEIKTVEEQKALNCLMEAETAAQATETAQKAKEAAIAEQMASKGLYRAPRKTSQMASTRNKKKRTYREQVLKAYKDTLKKCQAGLYGSGHQAQNKLVAAKNELFNKTLHAQDQEGLLNAKRQQMIEGLKQAQIDEEKQKQEAKTQLGQAMQNAQMQQMMANMTQAQNSQLTPEQQALNSSLQEEYEDANAAYQDAVASRQVQDSIPGSCTPIAREDVTTTQAKDSAIRESVTRIKSICDAPRCNSGQTNDLNATFSEEKLRSVCNAFYTKHATYFSSGNYTEYVGTEYQSLVSSRIPGAQPAAGAAGGSQPPRPGVRQPSQSQSTNTSR